MSHPHACLDCLRRAALIAALAPDIERSRYDGPLALAELLHLPNDELIAKVAPSRAASHQLSRAATRSAADFAAEQEAADSWATCQHDPAYPREVAAFKHSPPVLFGRGDASRLTALRADTSVAIVGSRRATSYGRELARQLGADLAAHGIPVVSGMAFGIDGCAHRGALDSGSTIAVMPCGPDVAFPAAQRSLWRRIIENGLVLSELPPGTSPWAWTFPARSRIIAAMAAITVVVEAGLSSSSLAAVTFADSFERRVGAVPGPVSSRLSAAPNQLLAAGGARVVRGAEDLLPLLG